MILTSTLILLSLQAVGQRVVGADRFPHQTEIAKQPRKVQLSIMKKKAEYDGLHQQHHNAVLNERARLKRISLARAARAEMVPQGLREMADVLDDANGSSALRSATAASQAPSVAMGLTAVTQPASVGPQSWSGAPKTPGGHVDPRLAQLLAGLSPNVKLHIVTKRENEFELLFMGATVGGMVRGKSDDKAPTLYDPSKWLSVTELFDDHSSSVGLTRNSSSAGQLEDNDFGEVPGEVPGIEGFVQFLETSGGQPWDGEDEMKGQCFWVVAQDLKFVRHQYTGVPADRRPPCWPAFRAFQRQIRTSLAWTHCMECCGREMEAMTMLADAARGNDPEYENDIEIPQVDEDNDEDEVPEDVDM